MYLYIIMRVEMTENCPTDDNTSPHHALAMITTAQYYYYSFFVVFITRLLYDAVEFLYMHMCAKYSVKTWPRIKLFWSGVSGGACTEIRAVVCCKYQECK